MNQMALGIFENYTPAGDAAVIAVCCVLGWLMVISYVRRTRSFRVFLGLICALVLAASVNIVFFSLLAKDSDGSYTLLCTLRIFYHVLVSAAMFLYIINTTLMSRLEACRVRKVAIVSSAFILVVLGFYVIRTLSGSFYDTEYLMSFHGYLLFFILMAVVLFRMRNMLYKQVFYGILGVMAISWIFRLIQILLDRHSLMTMSFSVSLIFMMYIEHSNPYDISLGAVDIRAMEDMIRNMDTKGQPFLFVSLMLPGYIEEGKELPEEIRARIRHFAENAFRGAVLFQIGKGHLVLIAPKSRNPDYEPRIQSTLADLQKYYYQMQTAYKVIVGESIDDISRKNEYISLIQSVNRSIPENTVHWINEEDISAFNRTEYILRELSDIYNRRDLDDPRVLAYCQPVFNLQTRQFDTAEALMRLKLDEIGIVYPDQFIHLAEEHGYIHVLTEIILNKTCQEIRRMTDEGFQITRISVNVSVPELKDDAFCKDIERIIADNGIPGQKIAIELTESSSEADFMVMKSKIEELREQGIKFYLDDFGTGYSNMERIMELPFDIIKFDRSLVIASRAEQRSEKIVKNLAGMFQDMEYSNLYEGVEDEKDEERCREMFATYLQGYKYSRPIPMDQLRDFLAKQSCQGDNSPDNLK